MFTVSTFYLSRVIGNKVFDESGRTIGRLKDLIADVSTSRPKIVAAKVRIGGMVKILDFNQFKITKSRSQYIVTCSSADVIELPSDTDLSLCKHVLDRQIVDIDGHKIVRVNDIRLAIVAAGTFAVAVDVGVEGLLRRLGLGKMVKSALRPFKFKVPSELILWDEVATVDFSNAGIKLSTKISKLSTLHPSDLADIIEDLDRNSQIEIFESLDHNKAADVLEELESEAQIAMLESMNIEKAADVLEMMPADEVADILDDLTDEKAEALLREMESEASDDVRELMEYPENTVGSLMSTDFISFNSNYSVSETLNELRKLKPESDTIYYLYVLDDESKLTATVSLRDIVISEPEIKLNEIMNDQIIYVYDTDKIDLIADMISKYNLLAIPVVEESMVMVGMVVIDDIVHTMIKSRKRRM